MKRLKLNKARQERFLRALADTGSVTAAVAVAGTSRTRVYELRKADPAFAAGWDEAEEVAADRLEDEARRRAVEGVQEPLVSSGKIVRDDNDQPIAIRRYSDMLLLALLKAHQPEKFRERPLLEHKITRNLKEMSTEDLTLIAQGVLVGPVADGDADEESSVVH
jgi:hypothetical protein